MQAQFSEIMKFQLDNMLNITSQGFLLLASISDGHSHWELTVPKLYKIPYLSTCEIIERQIDYETEYAEYELSKDWETS